MYVCREVPKMKIRLCRSGDLGQFNVGCGRILPRSIPGGGALSVQTPPPHDVQISNIPLSKSINPSPLFPDLFLVLELTPIQNSNFKLSVD